ncbi:alkene reductase [Phenylobacterium terrae]|uniref:Alkene reductase n=1 Tax=Phenylobacterium terrae TaxID=2665495 RepID=A0ABW4MWE8_9CAUL
MTSIWDPIRIGRMALAHRFAMAPMTRSRAQADGAPGPLAAEYYAQRAGFGLIITEGVQPSDDGQGYLNTPGIYTEAHVAGWRRVTDAVHARGGHLFMQLMHAGRMAHPDNTPHHRQPVAPSAIAPGQTMFTAAGLQEIPEPRALSTDEVEATVRDFVHAARQAIAAGADGVEIHAANGYLIQQFFASNANRRTDRYGGPIENRMRFAIEVARAVSEAIGPERTGLRISPGSTLGGIDEGPEGPALYRRLVPALAELDLAYLHVAQGGNEALLGEIRRLWPNALLVARGGRPLERAAADVEAGLADVAPVARWALANPDFVERYRRGAPLNEADPATFYGGGAHGYTDYPTFGRALVAA